MSDWSCGKCRNGMYYDKERCLMVICDCPKGEAKRAWLAKSPEERDRERREAMRRKKREKGRDRVPF